MAKGQKRPNREQKKPKAKKPGNDPASMTQGSAIKGFLAGSPPPVPKKKG